ncbi:hypothetical protein, partial [Nesterenkonia alkaliphila]|uniref:hypothetical protein n=1 Tax=Nesterenkonia alkaliphila TaxID=1463631 RepID=UPI001E5012EA
YATTHATQNSPPNSPDFEKALRILGIIRTDDAGATASTTTPQPATVPAGPLPRLAVFCMALRSA